ASSLTFTPPTAHPHCLCLLPSRRSRLAPPSPFPASSRRSRGREEPSPPLFPLAGPCGSQPAFRAPGRREPWEVLRGSEAARAGEFGLIPRGGSRAELIWRV
ncbi:alpha/beta-Hydrolases superfamily protein, partial [Zea mays]